MPKSSEITENICKEYKMENKAFRWCFIGTGKLAHQVAAEIVKSGRHEIVSV